MRPSPVITVSFDTSPLGTQEILCETSFLIRHNDAYIFEIKFILCFVALSMRLDTLMYLWHTKVKVTDSVKVVSLLAPLNSTASQGAWPINRAFSLVNYILTLAFASHAPQG